jgi:transcriptional regulator with XRE-family HTH domain
MTYGERFRQMRHTLGLSQEKLAHALGVGTYKTIARWEADICAVPHPYWEKLEELCSAKNTE